MGASESVPQASVHEFTVKDCNGKEVCLETYKGKVLLVVNVASKCGFTETNYTQLTDLYQKYREKGCVPMFVEIIGCNFSGRSGVGIGYCYTRTTGFFSYPSARSGILAFALV